MVVTEYAAYVYMLLNQGDGRLALDRSYGATINPSDIAIGDLNSDQVPDLVFSSLGTGAVNALLGKPDGSLGVLIQLLGRNASGSFSHHRLEHRRPSRYRHDISLLGSGGDALEHMRIGELKAQVQPLVCVGNSPRARGRP